MTRSEGTYAQQAESPLNPASCLHTAPLLLSCTLVLALGRNSVTQDIIGATSVVFHC